MRVMKEPKGISTLSKHPTSKTFYVSIPADITTHEKFPFKEKEKVKIELDMENEQIIISKFV